MFISHYHEDHFSPLDALAYLECHPNVHLFQRPGETRAIKGAAETQGTAGAE